MKFSENFHYRLLIKEQTEHMIATSIEQIPNIPCFDDSPRGRLLHGAAYLFISKAMIKPLFVNLLSLLESIGKLISSFQK